MARRDDLSRFSAMFNDDDDRYRVSSTQLRRERRRARVGRLVTAVVLVLIVALVGGYCYATLTAPVDAAVASPTAPTAAPGAAVQLAMPQGQSAISVSGADEYLGPTASGIYAASGGDDAAPIASISKLVTAMVILERKPVSLGDEGPTLTFSKEDHALYDKYYLLGATIAPMPTGSSMSEHDALETMLVASASNYAEAVSTWAFGSQPAFVAAARGWLKRNGLAHTRFYEPTGLDTRNAGSPSDLIALGKIAKANPVVAAIVSMRQTDVPSFDPLSNTNSLLGVDGIDGLKTGTLEQTGSNLLFSATLEVGLDTPLTVIGVVLGGGNRDTLRDNIRALLGSLKNGFHTVDVAKKDAVVGTYATPWGSSAKMVVASDAALLTWSDTPVTATMSTPELGDGKDGEQLATITYTAGPRSTTAQVVLDGSIRKPSEWWRLTHPKELLWGRSSG